MKRSSFVKMVAWARRSCRSSIRGMGKVFLIVMSLRPR